MYETDGIPDEFRKRVRGGTTYSPDRPMISVSGNNIYILTAGHEAMGEPDALRCFISGNRVGLLPADPEHPNAYPISTNKQISARWLQSELTRDTHPEGRFPLERDGNLWVADFSPEGHDPAQSEEGDDA
jgi:hypothetical protein